MHNENKNKRTKLDNIKKGYLGEAVWKREGRKDTNVFIIEDSYRPYFVYDYGQFFTEYVNEAKGMIRNFNVDDLVGLFEYNALCSDTINYLYERQKYFPILL